jgi:hypothetical protein
LNWDLIKFFGYPVTVNLIALINLSLQAELLMGDSAIYNTEIRER